MFQTINLHRHLNEVVCQGWSLIPIQMDCAYELANQALHRFNLNFFKEASLSQSATPHRQIRNDQILWLDAKQLDLAPIELETLNGLEDLKSSLSQYFRIHLSEIECHYAIYEPGHFYHRHQDITQINNKRIFSFVIYLNENWADDDAGELIGYKNNTVLFKIKPQFSMILFKSDVEHEVKVTNRQRLSLTGWFRK